MKSGRKLDRQSDRLRTNRSMDKHRRNDVGNLRCGNRRLSEEMTYRAPFLVAGAGQDRGRQRSMVRRQTAAAPGILGEAGRLHNRMAVLTAAYHVIVEEHRRTDRQSVDDGQDNRESASGGGHSAQTNRKSGIENTTNNSWYSGKTPPAIRELLLGGSGFSLALPNVRTAGGATSP